MHSNGKNRIIFAIVLSGFVTFWKSLAKLLIDWSPYIIFGLVLFCSWYGWNVFGRILKYKLIADKGMSWSMVFSLQDPELISLIDDLIIQVTDPTDLGNICFYNGRSTALRRLFEKLEAAGYFEEDKTCSRTFYGTDYFANHMGFEKNTKGLKRTIITW